MKKLRFFAVALALMLSVAGAFASGDSLESGNAVWSGACQQLEPMDQDNCSTSNGGSPCTILSFTKTAQEAGCGDVYRQQF